MGTRSWREVLINARQHHYEAASPFACTQQTSASLTSANAARPVPRTTSGHLEPICSLCLRATGQTLPAEELVAPLRTGATRTWLDILRMLHSRAVLPSDRMYLTIEDSS